MPALMKKNFGEMNPVKIAVVGLVLLLLATAAALDSGSIIAALTTDTYKANFADASGLASGDNVEISGVVMGTVKSVDLEGNYVQATFSVKHGGHLGSMSGASISSSTLLGTKIIKLTSDGTGTLAPGSTIPLSRTTSPYDLTQVLATLTTQAGQVNAQQLATAFNTISATLKNAPPDLRSALTGVEGLSNTISSRDAALTQLVRVSDQVTKVLAQRTTQVRELISAGNQILATLYQRRTEIRELLASVTAVADQLKGLVADNEKQIGPALANLQQSLTLLKKNDANVTAAINGLYRYAGSLGETVGSGPWFYAYIANLAPTNLVPYLPTLFGK